MTVLQDQLNPSAVLLKAGDLVVQNRPVPGLGATDVLVNIKATGICGSDVHYFVHGRNGDVVVEEPLVMGHESAGEVVAIGSEVRSLKCGDRVALEPGVACKICDMCKLGQYNLCPDMALLSDNRGNVKAGDRVLVLGAGPVGLLCCAAAKAAGAYVMVADIMPSRLKFAESFYTDAQILLDRPGVREPNIEYARRTAAQIFQQYGGYADSVLDCTGVETCVQLAVLLTKNGGAAVLVGLGASAQALPVAEIANRQVDIRGIRRYCNVSACVFAGVGEDAIRWCEKKRMQD